MQGCPACAPGGGGRSGDTVTTGIRGAFRERRTRTELGSDLSSRGEGTARGQGRAGQGRRSALATVLLDRGPSCTEELLERMARKPTVCESEVRAVGGRAGWAVAFARLRSGN